MLLGDRFLQESIAEGATATSGLVQDSERVQGGLHLKEDPRWHVTQTKKGRSVCAAPFSLWSIVNG
jgi:hypothetical protein